MKNAKIENLLKQMVKENVFPGANYALLTKNNCYMGSVGNKCLIPEVVENSIETLYDLASLTKVIVTNTIITKLLAKNKISLTDKVNTYLPLFKHQDITLFDLLTHSSGLQSDLSWRTVNSKEELLSNLYNLDLKYKVGEQVVYSDVGFILLGLIIEKIYQKSLDIVACEEVFTPLNMTNSFYNPIDKARCAPTEVTEQRGIVQGIVHDEKANILGGVAGHAGVFSTVEDLVEFCRMVQNDGFVNGKEFLPKEYIDLWFKPCKRVDDQQFRSIGWIVGKSENITGDLGDLDTMYHTGFTGNHIIINRKLNIYGVLLTNRIHPSRETNSLHPRRKEFLKVCYEISKEESDKKYEKR